MIESIKIIDYLEAVGHEINVEDDNIRISNGGHLPFAIKEQITNHKYTIIDILERDKKARDCQYQIGIRGTLYYREVSVISTSYIEWIHDEWQLWRETYEKGLATANSTKTIAISSDFDYVLDRSIRYFEYIEEWNNQRMEVREGNKMVK